MAAANFGVIDFTVGLVFQLVQAALGTAVTQGFPLAGSQFGQTLLMPPVSYC